MSFHICCTYPLIYRMQLSTPSCPGNLTNHSPHTLEKEHRQGEETTESAIRRTGQLLNRYRMQLSTPSCAGNLTNHSPHTLEKERRKGEETTEGAIILQTLCLCYAMLGYAMVIEQKSQPGRKRSAATKNLRQKQRTGTPRRRINNTGRHRFTNPMLMLCYAMLCYVHRTEVGART